MTDPTGTTTWAWDTAGNLTSVAYAGGWVINYGWDLAGRKTSQTGPHGTTTYAYDADSNLTGWSHGASGGLLSYDPAGRITTETTNGTLTRSTTWSGLHRTSYAETGDGAAKTWNLTHNPAGQLTSATNGSTTTTYQYDLVKNAPSFELSWDQAYPPSAITPIHQAVQQFFNGQIDEGGFIKAMQALPSS